MDHALVPSLTEEGKTWLVAETPPASTLHCECPPFNMGKRKGEPCKHMRLFTAAKELMKRCAALHPGAVDTEALCGQCLVALLAASARKVGRRYILKTLARPRPGSRRARKTSKA